VWIVPLAKCPRMSLGEGAVLNCSAERVDGAKESRPRMNQEWANGRPSCSPRLVRPTTHARLRRGPLGWEACPNRRGSESGSYRTTTRSSRATASRTGSLVRRLRPSTARTPSCTETTPSSGSLGVISTREYREPCRSACGNVTWSLAAVACWTAAGSLPRLRARSLTGTARAFILATGIATGARS
jgi:hypothetical protein